MKNLLKFLVAVFLTALTSTVLADNHGHTKLGDLMIMQPEIRATPKSAPVSAGYLVIKNAGSEDDRLVSASAEFAGTTQLHNMEVVDGVARMRPQKDGIVIPAGGEVLLKKGGLHIMFMKLEEQMQAGENRKVNLTFEKAGSIEIEMNVVELGKMDHSGHDEDHSNHSGHGEMKKEAAEQ